MATARDTRSNPNPKFSLGEKVLCYEPDPTKARVMYEAKVLDVDITKDEKGKKIPEYFIHFSGWNKSWDRWVMEDQVQKDSEANRVLMVKLREQASKAHKRKRKVVLTADAKNSDSISNEEMEEPDEAEKSDLPRVEIEIPSQLKLKLEDDCYFIKRKKKLVQLPRTPSVLEILEGYYEHCVATHPEESKNLVRELVDGLRIYFDFTLPTLLLYNFEREQYRTVTGLSSETPFPPMQSVDRTMDNDGIVSSSTESTAVKVEASVNLQAESREEEAKTERTLRRRTLRGQPAEASQSSAVSSTSSSPERHAESAPKPKPEQPVAREPSTAAAPVPTTAVPLSPLSPRLNLSASKMPSQVYGPEHLLRLFVKLPGLLARNDMDETSLLSLLELVDDLLRYLADKSAMLFPEDAYFNAL